jgi:hypothetical protein
MANGEKKKSNFFSNYGFNEALKLNLYHVFFLFEPF